jgi:hypothetical protein
MAFINADLQPRPGALLSRIGRPRAYSCAVGGPNNNGAAPEQERLQGCFVAWYLLRARDKQVRPAYGWSPYPGLALT